jgi:large subunit ribosomal protein L11
VEITYYVDKSFTFKMKTPPVGYFLLKAARLEKGSGTAGRGNVGRVTRAQIQEIAEKKMKDLNAVTLEGAMNQVMGSARSMGIEVAE